MLRLSATQLIAPISSNLKWAINITNSVNIRPLACWDSNLILDHRGSSVIVFRHKHMVTKDRILIFTNSKEAYERARIYQFWNPQ